MLNAKLLSEKSQKTSLWIFFGLLAYAPLHIFLSTWIGTTFGILDAAKILFNIVLFVGFVLILIPSLRASWFKEFLGDKLLWLISGYALLTVFLATVRATDQGPEVLAVVYNLRFLLFFVYGLLLTRYFRPDWLIRRSFQLVLTVALAVMMFGAGQYLWLPNDALTHAGYSRDNGVLPAFFIDEKPDLERVMSTMRDPNSYGAYLLIIMASVLAIGLWNKNRDLRKMMGGFMALTVINLYFTFSRSAWIGAILTVGTVFWMYARQKKGFKLSRKIWLVAIALVVLLAGTTFVARDTYFVKNVIFHADEATVLEDPNQLRIRFFRQSLDAAVDNPLGHGPGTAGIVSIRNDEQGVVLTENYYLQVLYETGVVGLILFAGILVLVALRLYRLNDSWQAAALLAAFVGIAASNMLNHIWTVEAVALTWWGLAGLLIVNTKAKQREQK